MPEESKCRICGCTDDQACRGGCSWVEPDLCSECFEMKFLLGEFFIRTQASKETVSRLYDEAVETTRDDTPEDMPPSSLFMRDTRIILP